MKKTSISLIVAVALAGIGVAACTTPPPPSPIGFNYQVDNGPANRIVQVFDLSGNTVVQIRNVDPQTTHFYNAQNVEIPHKIVGESVVLSGLQNSFTVSSPLAASRVIRTAPIAVTRESSPAALVQTPASIPTAAPATQNQVPDEKLLAEITRIKKEIAELKQFIVTAEAQNAGQLAAAPAHPVAEAAPAEAEVVRVSFKDNSQHFQPPHEIRAHLVELAKHASSVEVRGFTDSEQASTISESLAKGRANAAKRFLIRRGVDGRKIRVQYEPAGKFVTDNSTAEGKAANRRVEIRVT
jgi:outer membrane protein OmpA-like peptidoglycan-associated protein